MKKLLLITYYWPPSGGAGVQRWLKLSKYLALQGTEVHILTVDPEKASYTTIDHSLLKDVHPKLHIHQTDSFEIINYYSKVVGKKNVPSAGFSNVNNESIVQKTVNSLRSNLFIPDPRKGWNKYAYKKAEEILTKYNIQTVITTSPPHSTQLIGLKLKERLNTNWIADLRDPWTDIYYYHLLGHSKWSKSKDKNLEKNVIERSDKILTVSKGLSEIFSSKSDQKILDKIKLIPNGFDPDDFSQPLDLSKQDNYFVIAYTGTMSNQYEPEVFFNALKKVKTTKRIKVQFVGSIASTIISKIKELDIEVEVIPTVPHDQIVRYQRSADALLLVIPKVSNAKGILTGKLFEYLASYKPIIGIVPEESDAREIIEDCKAGICFTRNEIEQLTASLTKLIHSDPSEINPDKTKIESFSRKHQAIQIQKLL
ncbi:glycosyltransferase family 4 protein [Vicingaceae bacterium]|nr:glycosyltransferase family 4 protein [Vicingaceae bacterium]